MLRWGMPPAFAGTHPAPDALGASMVRLDFQPGSARTVFRRVEASLNE